MNRATVKRRSKRIAALSLALIISIGCSSPEATQQNVEKLRGFKGLAILMSDFSAPAQIHFHDGTQFIDSRVPAYTDSRLRWAKKDHRLYVIQRLDGNSIFNLDLASGVRGPEVSVLRGLNLQDLIPLSLDRGWASALGNSKIVEVDLRTGEVLNGVEVQEDENDRDTDGSLDPSYLYFGNGVFGAYFQRLNGYAVVRPAKLLRWNVDGQVLESRNLVFKNPVTEFKRVGDSVYLGGADVRVLNELTEESKKGGIEKMTAELETVGVVITEKKLKGDLLDFEILRKDFGVAAVGTPDARLVAFNPETGEAYDEEKFPPIVEKGYRFVQVLHDVAEKRLLVADKGSADGSVRPKIRVFDENMVEQKDKAIELPLPPVQILRID